MPRKKFAKSRLWSFKQIQLNDSAPAGLSPRPWISIEVDPETRLVVEVRMADDPMLLLPDKPFWTQLKASRGVVSSQQPPKPQAAPAKPTRRPVLRIARTRGKANGVGPGH